jgi:hypothetical protein
VIMLIHVVMAAAVSNVASLAEGSTCRLPEAVRQDDWTWVARTPIEAFRKDGPPGDENVARWNNACVHASEIPVEVLSQVVQRILEKEEAASQLISVGWLPDGNLTVAVNQLQNWLLPLEYKVCVTVNDTQWESGSTLGSHAAKSRRFLDEWQKVNVGDSARISVVVKGVDAKNSHNYAEKRFDVHRPAAIPSADHKIQTGDIGGFVNRVFCDDNRLYCTLDASKLGQVGASLDLLVSIDGKLVAYSWWTNSKITRMSDVQVLILHPQAGVEPEKLKGKRVVVTVIRNELLEQLVVGYATYWDGKCVVGSLVQ